MEIIVEHLSGAEIEERGILQWPIWEKEPSRFDWHYDEPEQCLLLEGSVTVETENGSTDIKAGDFVTFPRGLSCVWVVKETVKKHYSLG